MLLKSQTPVGGEGGKYRHINLRNMIDCQSTISMIDTLRIKKYISLIIKNNLSKIH